MSRSTRRLAIRASIERSRARSMEAMVLLQQAEQAQMDQRIDSITAAGHQRELESAFRAAAIAQPTN